MHPAHWAVSDPTKPAVIMASDGRAMSYSELDSRSNRVAHLARDFGLRPGDNVAVLLENCPGYFEVYWGAQRSGLYLTPISTRLTPGEIAHILRDSGAKLFITSRAMADTAAKLPPLIPFDLPRLMIGDAAPGYDSYDAVLMRYPATPIAGQISGAIMFYSSGTTGRSKGIKRPMTELPFDAETKGIELYRALYGFNSEMIYLSPAPLYHAAPLVFTTSTMAVGGTVVVMEHFDAEAALRLIEKYKVTSSQWVPTMFVRLLRLPDDVRARYDLSTHKVAVHAAAPCPVEIKRQMIEWWGPVLYEYYAGSEGNGFTNIASADWLAHPGSVGRAVLGDLHILDENGGVLGPGEAGTIYFANGPAFEYHNDPDKTRQAYNADGWSTLGDVGYVDTDGYLFLTDRKAYMIISGGVNIYPQEAENVLITHPKVADVAVFGVPNDEFGEEVKAVVQPLDMASAGPDLARELIEFCRERLADVKCPRSIDFDAELPRAPTGKLYKRLLRDRYWANRASKII